MAFIKTITIRNFKCFRRTITINFENATYLVGINNSGKTALLSAVSCFFRDSDFSAEYLNKTELTSRQEGATRSDITLEFDLKEVTGKARSKRLTDQFGETLRIRKSFTFREASQTVFVEYFVMDSDDAQTFDLLDADLRSILQAVSVSYIHPQQGEELLKRAQEKFKARLFHNWGRHPSLAGQLSQLQNQWDQLRTTANTYLSAALTNKLKKIWPQSSAKIDLPARIEEIVAVSDISFRSAQNLPEVTLTSQGTGAQSIILYQTHFILDSDRSLHQGFYQPVWLLEEPESFLHADISIQLGQLLSSSEWLDNIQMVISTHSALILAQSRQSKENAQWVIFDNYAVKTQKKAAEFSEQEITDVGLLLGDPNFDAYFLAAGKDTLVFTEDAKDITVKSYRELGIDIAKGLNGTSEVKRFLMVLESMGTALNNHSIFIVDNDKGIRELNYFIDGAKFVVARDGFTLYGRGDIALLTLPEDYATENLFDEFSEVLDKAIGDVLDDAFQLRKNIPLDLSRVASKIRSPGGKAQTIEAARKLLSNESDIKDRMWRTVEEKHLKIATRHGETIKFLIETFVAANQT